MKKHLITLFAFFLLPIISNAQIIEWQNSIGGSSFDELKSIAQTNDGGYILGGYSESNISGDKTENSNGDWDYWIVKTDSLGVILWQNTIGGNGIDRLYSIAQTPDGGFILGGFSNSSISGDKTELSTGNTGLQDIWIVKLNALGNIEWQNTIGGNTIDVLFSIGLTTDGGYILGGTSNSNISGDKTENNNGVYDYWILKINSLGDIQWQNTIGSIGDEKLNSIVQTSDGGYILGGYSYGPISGDKSAYAFGYEDYWVIKTDSSGVIQWQKSFGGNSVDNLISITQTSDGGYILGGRSESGNNGNKSENSNGGVDYWIVKINSTGDMQWQNTIGGSGDDWLSGISQTIDDGYILGGISYSNISGDKTENNVGESDCWIVKINSLGVIQWQKTIGGSGDDGVYSISQTSDSGYILGGNSESNISGDKTENSNGQFDYWIVKIAENPTSLTEYLNEYEVLLLYPNPANSYLTIESRSLMASGSKLTVSDVAGRTLLTKSLGSNSTKHQIDISSFSSGIYFVQLEGGKGIERGRFVKE